jgi:hypothetical protein
MRRRTAVERGQLLYRRQGDGTRSGIAGEVIEAQRAVDVIGVSVAASFDPHHVALTTDRQTIDFRCGRSLLDEEISDLYPHDPPNRSLERLGAADDLERDTRVLVSAEVET